MDTLAVISLKQLRDIWLAKEWKSGETFHLYVHNPFCLTECTFCKHQGQKTKIGSSVYETYYRDYLPRLISAFSPVIRSRPVESVYFGGGTSSMMTTTVMEEIFLAIPGFQGIKYKTFECSPSLLDEEKVRVLARYGFTYVSFGVQTFSTRILHNNNRPPIALNRLRSLAQLTRNNGMVLNCDILTFIDTKTEADLDQLDIDLRTLAAEIQPEAITVYPETFSVRGASTAEQLSRIGSLRHRLSTFADSSNGEYQLYASDKRKLFSIEDIKENLTMDYRLYRRDLDSSALSAIRSYNCSGAGRAPAHQSTLGMGSRTGEKDPSYTYLGGDFYCVEVNDGWVPRYHVKRDTGGLLSQHLLAECSKSPSTPRLNLIPIVHQSH